MLRHPFEPRKRSVRAKYCLSIVLAMFADASLVSVAAAQGYMYGQASLGTGNKPGGFAIADFNGDGRLDLAVTNESDNTVSILLSKANGSYSAKVDYKVGNNPMQAAAGDFNGDGIMDIAVVDAGDNTVSILLGVGDGTFKPQVTYPTGAFPVAVATADFNGDKHLDLAVVNQTDGTISILFGNGDGTFVLQTENPALTVGPTSSSIFAGDMNGDGKPDLVVLSGVLTNNGNVSVLVNNGNGTFHPALAVVSGDLGGMAVGDINHDGILDIVATDYSSDQIYILLGNGTGGFRTTSVSTTGSLGAPPQTVALGDFNHDGSLDIAVYQYYSVAIYTGNGDGTFNGPVLGGIPSMVSVAPMLASADFNNDGLSDLPVLLRDDNAISILLGNGDGTLGSRKDLMLPASGGMAAAVVTEVTSGGKPDVMAAQFNQPSQGPIQGFITSILGDGNGAFQAPTGGATGDIGINGIVSGDFNADGITDLATASVDGDGGLAVFLGKGDGTYGPPISSYTGVTGLNLGPMISADFNGDGKTDLVVVSESDSSTNSSPMYLLLSQGDGTFGPLQLIYQLPYGFVPSLALGDLNKDGLVDLVAASQQEILVFLAKSDGSFATPTSYSYNFTYFNGVVIGDFNGDGKPDLVVTGGGQILFFAGNGDGTFAEPVISPLLSNGIQLVVGDFNGDGNLDLAMNGVGLSQAIVLGNGDGTFQNLSPFQGTYYPRIFTTGDVNGDGTMDLLQFSTAQTTSVCPQTMTVWSSAPVISFSAPSINFGAQEVGTTSAGSSVSLANAGNAPLVISGIAASSDFAETNTCPATLSIGEVCTVTVTFTPTASGTRTGNLTISDNSTARTQTIALAGAATALPTPDFTIGATPAANTVQPGGSTSYTVTLAPENGFTGAAQITCSGAPAESTCLPSGSSVTLDGSHSATVQVNITTTAASYIPPVAFDWRWSPLQPPVVLFGCLWALLCILAASARSRGLRVIRFVAPALLGLVLMVVAGCGGGSQSTHGTPSQTNPGTPIGNYTITVTASSGNTTHTTTVTLTVN